jgi:hypothetical protein
LLFQFHREIAEDLRRDGLNWSLKL